VPGAVARAFRRLGLRFPALFLILLTVTLADLAIPDIIPFVDEIVLAAEAKVAPIDPRRAAAMLVSAGEAAAFAGLGEGEIEAGRRAALLRSTGTDDLFELSMMAGIGSLLGGDAATGAPLLREAITAAEASDNPRRLFWAGSSSLYLLDESGARSYFSRAARSQSARRLACSSSLRVRSIRSPRSCPLATSMT